MEATSFFLQETLQKKDTDIQQNKSQFVGSALEYRNPLNNIFFNVRYNFNQTDKNILFSYTQDPNNQQNIVRA